MLFIFNDPATTAIYTLSLHDALPIFSSNSSPPTLRLRLKTIPAREIIAISHVPPPISTIMLPAGSCTGNPTPMAEARSEEHTSELQSRRELVCRLLLEKKKEK